MLDTKTIRWSFDTGAGEWDRMLARFGGHPLQSALWGQARCRAEGVEDRRWVAFSGDLPVWMGRFEIRHLPLQGRVAWLPRGPVPIDHPLAPTAHCEFLDLLKKEGYLICFTDPYPSTAVDEYSGNAIGNAPQTLWVDLSKGPDFIFDNMHKKLRYGVRAAERAGVVLEESRSRDDVKEFFRICNQISDTKDFFLPGSEKLMQELITLSQLDAYFKAHLFVARCEGKIASGYFSIENGSRLHNLWNGTDRTMSKQCPGEAVLWHQIAWGVAAGLKTYDQEGIDMANNPGCYHFKKRLGGAEITLPGLRAHPLGMAGRAALTLGQWMGKI